MCRSWLDSSQDAKTRPFHHLPLLAFPRCVWLVFVCCHAYPLALEPDFYSSLKRGWRPLLSYRSRSDVVELHTLLRPLGHDHRRSHLFVDMVAGHLEFHTLPVAGAESRLVWNRTASCCG